MISSTMLSWRSMQGMNLSSQKNDEIFIIITRKKSTSNHDVIEAEVMLVPIPAKTMGTSHWPSSARTVRHLKNLYQPGHWDISLTTSQDSGTSHSPSPTGHLTYLHQPGQWDISLTFTNQDMGHLTDLHQPGYGISHKCLSNVFPTIGLATP